MSPVEDLMAFTVRLKADEHERLRKLAEVEHRSLGAQARIAVIEHLTAEDAKEVAA